MDGDVYVAEYIIRDRLAEARARAKVAALHGEANQDAPRANGIGHRLLEFARSVVKKGGRMGAGARQPLGGGPLDDLHSETTRL